MLIKDKLKTYNSSVDPQEVEKFNRLSEEWWKTDGVFKVIHDFNKQRVKYLTDTLSALFGVQEGKSRPLTGLRLLDAGCGAGLVSEPMTRLGAMVIGIDPSEQNIKIAREHAQKFGVDVSYSHILAEDMDPIKHGLFDIVLSLEVVEHVGNLNSYLKAVGRLVKPKGFLIIGTLNRTIASFIKAIVGAEYILRLLPQGTHSWHKFVTPKELEDELKLQGFIKERNCGISYHPFRQKWKISNDLSVNYLQIHRKIY